MPEPVKNKSAQNDIPTEELLSSQIPKTDLQIRKSPDYAQDEETLDDGHSIIIRRKTLFHGSNTKGIKRFQGSENITVGYGIYLTSKLDSAIGYARQRKGRANPISEEIPKDCVVYETGIKDLKLVDLRDKAFSRVVFRQFREFLYALIDGERENQLIPLIKKLYPEADDKSINTFMRNGILREYEEIKQKDNNAGLDNLYRKDWLQKLFSEFLNEKGYDGLIIEEGGEPPHAMPHDSYVIFNPDKIKIKKEFDIV